MDEWMLDQLTSLETDGNCPFSRLSVDFQDPFAYPWELMSKGLAAVPLQKYALLICTEPVAGCLMLRQWLGERAKGHRSS